MGLTDIIAIIVIAICVGGAILYIIKAKKSGKKCIGCPYASTCGSTGRKCSSCSEGSDSSSDNH